MSRSGSEIRVLAVERDPRRRRALERRLEGADAAIAVASVGAGDAALDRLADERFDCVVTGHDEDDHDSVAFVRAVRAENPELPVVVCPADGSESLAGDAIAAGVTGYVPGGGTDEQYRTLAERIVRAVSGTRTNREQQRLSTLVSNLPGMVYRCRNDRGWPMTFVSEGAEELTGYDAAAIERGGVDWGTDIIHPDDRESMWGTVQSAIDADEPFEVTYRIQTADGETRWMWERGQLLTRDDDTEILEGFVTEITSRKERERALREQRAFVEDVLNSLEDMFYVVAPDGSMRRWNDRVVEVTGYGDSEIETMVALDFVAPDDVSSVKAAIDRAVETGSARYKAAIRTNDGETIPFEFHATPLYDSNDGLVGIAGVGRDITDRTERERALRQYKALTESVADPMYVMAPDGTITMVNEALANHIGHDRSEIVGSSPGQFLLGDSVERAEACIEELLTTEKEVATFEMETIDNDGEETHNEAKISVMTDDDGQFEGTAGVVRDITERTERERELERYETILQAIGDPVYTLDADGHFTVVNDAMEALSGYDRDELVGEHISRLMTEEDLAAGEDLIAELLADDDRTNGTFEMMLVAADGREVPCENHVALLPADDSQFRGTAGVIRDITDRKQRERQLEQFASVVSHDLRSPLNVVQGRIEHVLSTGDHEHLADAADAARRMESLIDDLLTLAHEGQRVSELEPVALDVVAADAWSQLDGDGATLVAETERRVEADFDRLRELFDNLFRNTIEHGDADTVRVIETTDGFAVVDDGSGIPDERRETVFERGFTTSDDGTGFGLAIVSEIVEAHDWSVEVGESDSGGARFEITT